MHGMRDPVRRKNGNSRWHSLHLHDWSEIVNVSRDIFHARIYLLIINWRIILFSLYSYTTLTRICVRITEEVQVNFFLESEMVRVIGNIYKFWYSLSNLSNKKPILLNKTKILDIGLEIFEFAFWNRKTLKIRT